MNKEPRDIEYLVNWALEDQGLIENFVEVPRSTRKTAEDYGTRISTSWVDFVPIGRSAGGDGAHPDAVTVAEALVPVDGAGRDTVEALALVVHFGRSGFRPDWCPEGPGDWVAELDKRGRVKTEPVDPDHPRGKRRPILRFEGTPAVTVDFHRRQYSAWWLALRDLCDLINPDLRQFRATGPRAPQAPWQAQGRVLRPDDDNAA